MHDVIEDAENSNVMENEVKKEFGEKVLSGVLALSKDNKLDKEKRMEESIRRIKAQGKEIACVKLADRITNLQKPPEYWSKEQVKKYLDESIMIYNELGAYSDFLGNRLKHKIEEYEQYLLV